MKLRYIAEGMIIETWHDQEHSNRIILELKLKAFSNLIMAKARNVLEPLGLLKSGRHVIHTPKEPIDGAREVFLKLRQAVQTRLQKDMRTIKETGLGSSETGEIELFWGYDFNDGTYGAPNLKGTFDSLVFRTVRKGSGQPIEARIRLLESLIDLV